jgi:hypothetical protein
MPAKNSSHGAFCGALFGASAVRLSGILSTETLKNQTTTTAPEVNQKGEHLSENE